FKYCSATRQSPSLKITTRCHSVFSRRSPVALSRQVSEVATLKLAIGRPSCVRLISGSLPRLPTRITLFTLPAMTLSCSLPASVLCTLIPSPGLRRRFLLRHHAFPQRRHRARLGKMFSVCSSTNARPLQPLQPAFLPSR